MRVLKSAPPRSAAAVIMFVMVTGVGACAKGDDTPRDTASAGGTVSGDANASASGASVFTDEDVSNVRLSMAKVDQFYKAWRDGTIAAGNRVESETASEDMEDLDDIVKEIERDPKVVAAVRKAGLSVREFIALQLALTAAMLANETLKLQPNTNIDSLARELEIPAANIRFVRENSAEIEAKAKAAKAAIEAAGVRVD